MSEPQKVHPTGECVIVAYNGDCVLLRLASSLATVVSEAVSEAVRQAVSENKIQVLVIFFKFYIQPPVSVLLYIMYYMD